jgi:hypothetical protein
MRNDYGGGGVPAGTIEPFDPGALPQPGWFSYSAFDTFERCPRQYAYAYLCRLPAEGPRPAADFGTAAHGAFEAFTRERRERLARGEPPPTTTARPAGPEGATTEFPIALLLLPFVLALAGASALAR